MSFYLCQALEACSLFAKQVTRADFCGNMDQMYLLPHLFKVALLGKAKASVIQQHPPLLGSVSPYPRLQNETEPWPQNT